MNKIRNFIFISMLFFSSYAYSAMKFGPGAYITVTQKTPLTAPSGSLSISAWVKPTSFSTDQRVISLITAGSSKFAIVIGRASGKYSVFARNPTDGLLQLDSVDNFSPDGNWHLVVATLSSDILNLYIDGNFEGTLNVSSAKTLAFLDKNLIQFSGNGIGLSFNGSIDDPRIYSDILSPQTIASLLTKQRIVTTEKSIGWWKLNEVAAGVPALGISIFDYSGNNNSGFVTGNVIGDDSILVELPPPPPPPPPPPALTPLNCFFSSVLSDSLSLRWDNVLGSTFTVMFSSYSDFSLIISSNDSIQNFTRYGGLTPNTPYFFKAKVSNEPDDAYLLNQISTGTLVLSSPPQTIYVLTQDELNDIKQEIWVHAFKGISEAPDIYWIAISTDNFLNSIKIRMVNLLLDRAWDDVTWPVDHFDSINDVENITRFR